MIAINLKNSLAMISLWDKYFAERIQAQIQFAQALCALHPDKAGVWEPIIGRTDKIINEAVASDPGCNIEALVKDVEVLLAPLAETAKTYAFHCIGHAHIDMNWMWSWPETVAVVNDSFTTVLKLMEEFPQFRFSQSQASVYAIIEKHNPDLLKKIKKRVREGRWEVTASHWVENDKNMVGGEALCRHILYTRKYIRKLFGLSPEDVPVDWSPDTFGHPTTVPTYLVRGGIKYLYLTRPGAVGPARPRAFRWQAPDGSTVLVKNDMDTGYGCYLGPHLAPYLVNFAQETGLRFINIVYGVCDHGGGPTRRDILRGIDMGTWPIFPNVVFTTAKQFFEKLDKEGTKLPTLDCELNYEVTGCYTTQSLIKKVCRYGEKKLIDAEKASVLAWAAFGAEYENDQLEEGWREILFSHFHDILPGSGVHDTRTYCHGMFQKTMATTALEETKALRLLASKVATDKTRATASAEFPPSIIPSALGAGVGYGAVDGGISQAEQSSGYGNRPFLVFNTSEFTRKEIVEATVWDNSTLGNYRKDELKSISFSVRTPEGKILPCQTLETGTYYSHDFIRFAFPVEAPGLGYGVYTILEQKAPEGDALAKQNGMGHHCFYLFYERSPEGLENEFIKFELNTRNGGIKALIDKKTEKTIIANSAPLLEYAVERPHTMTAWCIDHTGPAENIELISVTRKFPGPYKASIDAKIKIHESEIIVTYEVRAGDPNLYIHINSVWFQRGTPQTGVPVLNLALALKLDNPAATYEIPFGATVRNLAHGEEVPALRWAKVTGQIEGGKFGCLLLNDSKHGHSFQDGILKLSLIRSSYDPDILPEIGRHEIHTAIRVFSGDLSAAETIRAGCAFNHELKVIGTDIHHGEFPDAASLINVEAGTAIISGIKKAEDASGLIFRLFNPENTKTNVTIKFNIAMIGKIAEAQALDLMERPVKNAGVKFSTDTLSCSIPSYGLITLLAKLKK